MDKYEEDYVFSNFFIMLPKIEPQPNRELAFCILRGLEAGDERFYNALSWEHSSKALPDAWETAFGAALDSFQEANPANEGPTDDIPF